MIARACFAVAEDDARAVNYLFVLLRDNVPPQLAGDVCISAARASRE
jgi:hypothetical protein